ncbi:hypothetical protein Tco_0627333 [Tanacetum coccineum]|uniref:Uncharacterized protein n=1 Tax=Tanacetum coccineum TaxID=301880 RepID=A0ABQ4WMX6_9ASTR
MGQMLYQFQENQRDYFSNDTFRGRSLVPCAYEVTLPDIFPMRHIFGGVTEINPFKDVLVFRRMVEFLGALPINLKGNMWESEDLIENPINWDKPPKSRDGACHAKIWIIDPDREEFTKTFQSIPTSRKLSEKENPREIIDLDHFHDT